MVTIQEKYTVFDGADPDDVEMIQTLRKLGFKFYRLDKHWYKDAPDLNFGIWGWSQSNPNKTYAHCYYTHLITGADRHLRTYV